MRANLDFKYHKICKYWDRKGSANNAYPDQTAPEGDCTLFAILSACFRHITAL